MTKLLQVRPKLQRLLASQIVQELEAPKLEKLNSTLEMTKPNYQPKRSHTVWGVQLALHHRFQPNQCQDNLLFHLQNQQFHMFSNLKK